MKYGVCSARMLVLVKLVETVMIQFEKYMLQKEKGDSSAKISCLEKFVSKGNYFFPGFRVM